MQSYETLTEIHARRLLALMKITDSHRRNLVEYGEALSIDENGEEDEDEKHHDETYICDHPGSDGAGEVLETTMRTPPLLLLGHGRVPPGSGATSSSIVVCSKKAQHEPPLLKRGSCVSMFNVISTSGWNENEIVDFYCQRNMDEKDDGEEQEDGKPPISPEEEEQVVLAAAAVGPSIEICKADTSCASLGERKQNSKHRRKRTTRRRSSRFSIKSTKNFQSMFFS